MLEVRVLGPLEARWGDEPVELPGVATQRLLATLALSPGRWQPVERLIGDMWGGDAPTGARKALQMHVSRLRRALAAAAPEAGRALESGAAGYRLGVTTEQVDATRAERLIDDGRRALAASNPERARDLLSTAVRLWRGTPIAGLGTDGALADEQRRLEDLRLMALEQRIEADLLLGGGDELVGELQRLVAAHPWRERLHEQLMLALYRSGRQAEALDAYAQARAVLVKDLGIEPGPALRNLHRAVLAHDSALDARRPPRPSTGSLPEPPTRLFGREDDLRRLTDLITRSRLTSLLGPGGVGKTRLALALASATAAHFADGARFIALATVADCDEMAVAIAAALPAPVRDGEAALAALRRFLAGRQLLLVLDNIEHLLAGAPLIADLLAACPRLTIVLTSREPARLRAERLYPVAPLELPDPSLADLERCPSVALFCDRARARDPDFALDGISAPHVRAICRRLDGLPLALELAAAHADVLSPADLARRLDRALPLLVEGSTDAPDRHRTLRATIDWSVRLLTEEERRAFASMAVFAAGATATAAEKVTGASLATLEALAAKQMLVARGDRLVMLETVLEYGAERLAGDPAADEYHERLANWCCAFACDAVPRLRSRDRIVWRARLDAEMPNLLAALSWALKHGRQPLALALAAKLGEYWWQTSGWREGLPRLDAVLAHPGGAPPKLLARALLARARLTHRRDLDAFRSDLDAALERFRAAGDSAGAAYCLAHLTYVSAWSGDHAGARALADAAEREAERSGDEQALATVLLESLSSAQDYEQARARGPKAIRVLEAAGDSVGLVFACSMLGWHAIVAGAAEDAVPWLEQGVATAAEIDDPHAWWHVSNNLGLAYLLAGDIDAAGERLAQALTLAERAGDLDLADEPLLGMAGVAARRGQIELCARLAGAAAANRAPAAQSEDVVWHRLLDEFVRPARARCPAATWRRAEEFGASLTISRAVALAHEPQM